MINVRLSLQETITLEDLAGEHMLSGVDRGGIRINDNSDLEEAQTFSFILDGITYTAIEDPNDGYRSMMKEIVMSTSKIVNQFKPISVIAEYRGGGDDLLVIKDKENGHVILEVGTTEVDDYYPCFISNWNPANMAINQDPFFEV